jgi:hypothetical protein
LAVDRDGNATAIWAQGEWSTAVIQTSRYVAASQSWTPPAARSTPGQASMPDVAADAAGNAIAIWWTELTATTSVVQTARLRAATGTWSAVRDLVTENAISAFIAIVCDPAGNAMTVFALDGNLYWAWYVAATDRWTGPGRFTSGGGGSPDVAMDADGNAIAVWAHSSGVTFGARFARALESWLLPTIIVSSIVASPRIALNAAGDGQAVWVRTAGTQNIVEAMLYSAASRTWTGPTVLSTDGSAYPAVNVAVDASGNALAVWSRAYVQPCGFLCLQGARYVAAARMWPLTDNLSHLSQAAYNPQVQFDAHGNAVTVWGQSCMGYSATQARTWHATPRAPTVTGVGAAPGALTLAFLPPETSEAQLAAVNYSYSIDDGATWTTRSPRPRSHPSSSAGCSTVSPTPCASAPSIPLEMAWRLPRSSPSRARVPIRPLDW